MKKEAIAAINDGYVLAAWKAIKLSNVKDQVEQAVNSKLLDDAWTDAWTDLEKFHKEEKESLDNTVYDLGYQARYGSKTLVEFKKSLKEKFPEIS